MKMSLIGSGTKMEFVGSAKRRAKKDEDKTGFFNHGSSQKNPRYLHTPGE